MQLRAVHPDGGIRWLVSRAHLQTEGAGKPGKIIGVVQDITELIERTRQAEEANLAKSQFLSTVRHELLAPLHAMLGYLSLLKRELQGETLRRLTLVESSGFSFLNLINDLLEFNQGAGSAEELEPDTLELEGLIGQLEHFGWLQAKKGGNRFLINRSPDLPATVWVDEERLLQMLKNLLENAYKFTRNGVVTLLLTRVSGEDLQENQANAVLCRLRFTVKDTGTGIAPEELAYIFEPLPRGTSSQGLPGLGLDLAIARQWVKALGGEFSAESAIGQGSAFSFTLELATAPAISPSPSLIPPPKASIQLQMPAKEVAHFRQLLDLGLVVRIEDWAMQLAEGDSTYQALSLHIVQCCQDANLGELSRLAQDIIPDCHGLGGGFQ